MIWCTNHLNVPIYTFCFSLWLSLTKSLAAGDSNDLYIEKKIALIKSIFLMGIVPGKSVIMFLLICLAKGGSCGK